MELNSSLCRWLGVGLVIAGCSMGQVGQAAPADVVDVLAGQSVGGQKMTDIEQNQEIFMVPDEDIKLDIDATEFEKPVLELPEDLRMMVKGFHITGQDIVPEEKLLALLEGETDKLQSFGDMQRMAQKLTDYFKKKGYMTARVYIPAQKIIGGKVEFTVVIGKYDGITFENNTRIHDAQIRRQLAFLKEGDYVTQKELERAVWLLTDLAGADAKATLTTGQGNGTVHLHLVIRPHVNKAGFVYADNYGSRYTGYGEYGIQYDLVNLGHQGDHLAFNVLTTGHLLTNGSARYTLPVLKDGMNMYVGYSQVAYDLGAEYKVMRGTGQARVYSAGMNYALRRQEKNNLYTGLRYEHSTMNDAFRAFADSGMDRYNDKRGDAMIAELYGDELDRHGASSWRMEYKLGRVGLMNATTKILDGAHVEGWFSKARGSYIRRQNLNNRSYLMLVARGQLASKNLDSYEHMSLGGISGVRAYPTSEASADSAYLLKVEHRWLLPIASKKQTLHLASYFDHGAAWINKKPQPGDDNFRRMQGAGVGLIWQRPGEWFVRTDYAWRLGAEPVRSERLGHYANGHFWIQGGWYF